MKEKEKDRSAEIEKENDKDKEIPPISPFTLKMSHTIRHQMCPHYPPSSSTFTGPVFSPFMLNHSVFPASVPFPIYPSSASTVKPPTLSPSKEISKEKRKSMKISFLFYIF
jgi:hypothetical protein